MTRYPGDAVESNARYTTSFQREGSQGVQPVRIEPDIFRESIFEKAATFRFPLLNMDNP